MLSSIESVRATPRWQQALGWHAPIIHGRMSSGTYIRVGLSSKRRTARPPGFSAQTGAGGFTSARVEECRSLRTGTLYRLKSALPTTGSICEAPGEGGNHREGSRTSEKKIRDGGVANWFGRLFTHPISVRLSLDRPDELDFCR